jgi:hypothetical protein
VTLYERRINRDALHEVRECARVIRGSVSAREQLEASRKMRDAARRVVRFEPTKEKER